MIYVINRHSPESETRGMGVYVGRGTPLGNPYHTNGFGIPENMVSSRKEAIEKYKEYLYYKISECDKDICSELNRLYKIALNGDLTLVCSCKPLICHADIIKEILEEAMTRNKKKNITKGKIESTGDLDKQINKSKPKK
jgi:uncharacterized protein YeaO (DUF488 family)